MQLIYKEDIDINKWNDCVKRNANGLIYAYTFYLDAVCESYAGIVFGDYEAIFPLPFKKKLVFKYLYHPPFVQQLGLIGNTHVSGAAILQKIQQYFKYGDILLNFDNQYLLGKQPAFTNFIIDLSNTYNITAESFKDAINKNLKVAVKHNLNYEKTTLQNAIDNYKKNDTGRFDLSKYWLAKLDQLTNTLVKNNSIEIRCSKNETGETLAAIILFKDNKRIYNVINTINAEGRKACANYFLFNEVLKEFSGTEFLFDFEGSDIPGVKTFCQKFGAEDQPYFIYHFNKLPWPLKLLRK